MTAEELADRASIEQILLSYFRGIDRFEIGIVRDCFFEDAEVSLSSGDFRREEMLEQLETLHLSRFTRTMHVAANTIIELAGSVAHTEVYAIAYHVTTPDHHWGEGFVTVWLLPRPLRAPGRRVADRRPQAGAGVASQGRSRRVRADRRRRRPGTARPGLRLRSLRALLSQIETGRLAFPS